MIAARVLDALLRENYGDLSSRVATTRDGARLTLASGRTVRLAPGRLFQDHVVAPGEPLDLAEVLATLESVADPADAAGVAAFRRECAEANLAQTLLAEHRATTLARVGTRPTLIGYETLAALADHPLYPTSRARSGLSAADLLDYAPEFAPAFELRWAAVPGDHPSPAFFPGFAEVGLPELPGHSLFPVHPLTLARVRRIEGVVIAPEPCLTVRPTLSMRTVEVEPRTHLKLPLDTSTLGLRNRRSIQPDTLHDGALAQGLLEQLAGEDVLIADERTYAHTGHEYLAWLVRRLPPGEIIPVAAFPYAGLGERELTDYLERLLRWNVLLFVRYGVALEAHQQNLALVRGRGLLVKDNDGLLVSPARLRAAGLTPPAFRDRRLTTDDPHALADVFVTITLHLAAAAVAFAALPHGRAAGLLSRLLGAALDEHGDDPMAGVLRAHTLEAERLTGKSMVTAATLVAKERTGARDVNKYYGTSGPNYLRGHA